MLNMAVEKAQTATGRSSERMKNLSRLLRYILVRGVVLLITVTIGIYLTIIIANGGGYVDEIRKASIREQVSLSLQGNELLRDYTVEERKAYEERLLELEYKKLDLDKPFWQRSHKYLWNGMTLNFGRADYLLSDSGSSEVRYILGERLFPTLLLMASGQLLLFFISITFALFLSRRYGSPLDKLVVALAPMSAAPAWFFGIF